MVKQQLLLEQEQTQRTLCQVCKNREATLKRKMDFEEWDVCENCDYIAEECYWDARADFYNNDGMVDDD